MCKKSVKMTETVSELHYKKEIKVPEIRSTFWSEKSQDIAVRLFFCLIFIQYKIKYVIIRR